MPGFDCDYTEGPPSANPWLQGVLAFAPTGDVTFESGTPYSNVGPPSGVEIFPRAVGDLIVAMLHYKFDPTQSGATPPYDIEDTSENSWNAGPSQMWTDEGGYIWALQMWWAIANSTSTVVSTNCPDGIDGGQGDPTFGQLQCATFSCSGSLITFDSTVEGQGTMSGDLTPGLTITPTTPWPVIVSDLFTAPSLEGGDGVELGDGDGFSTVFNAGYYGGVSSARSEYLVVPYEGPPPPAPPLRYKRLPLKLDFASCSFDQADRLLMYELYRACGLDPSNPFLATLLDWDTPPPWQPPITLSLTVWGEAVDEMWNILKSGMASSDTVPGPICGKVITIDSVNYPEWCGDWEIVQCEYAPFSGQAAQNYGSQSGGEVTGSSELIGAPAEGSGMLSLTLRTYNPSVFFDASMTPSWIDVPGPWADGSY